MENQKPSRYFRNLEKSREKSRRAAARHRVRNGQVSMAEHRARVAERKRLRELERDEARKLAAEARRIAQAAQTAALAEGRRLKRLEQGRLWRLAHPGHMKEWKAKNRDKVRAAKRKRKVSKRKSLIDELSRLQRGRCAYCRCRLDGEKHVDHVMPLKLSGPDERSNLQLTCAPCNMAKSAHHPITYAQSIGRLL